MIVYVISYGSKSTRSPLRHSPLLRITHLKLKKGQPSKNIPLQNSPGLLISGGSYPATLKLVKKVITNLDSSKASNPDYISVVVLKNFVSELPNMKSSISEPLNIYLKKSFFSRLLEGLIYDPCICECSGEFYCEKLWPVSFFLWLVKYLKNLEIIALLITWRNIFFFSGFLYGSRSSQSTADLLTVVCDRICRAFNRNGATFNRVRHATLFLKLKSYGISTGLILSSHSNKQLHKNT